MLVVMSKKTSVNLIIDEDDNKQFTALVNAGTEHYSDGIPLVLYANILQAVCDTVDKWNQQHK